MATLTQPTLAVTVAPVPPKATLWTGRVVTGLVVAFLVFDALMKILRVPAVLEASAKLGYSEGTIVTLGFVLLGCVVLHLVPRTAVLGSVLLTGYFGGAMSLHVHVRDGAFPIAFAFAFGVLTWLGLYLRDGRVKAMIAARR